MVYYSILSVFLRRIPHPVIVTMTMKDNGDYSAVLFYSSFASIAVWGHVLWLMTLILHSPKYLPPGILGTEKCIRSWRIFIQP